MLRLARIIGIPLLMFVAAVAAALVLPEIVYPPVKVGGYDPHPLETMNEDLALDDQRRMVFLVVTLTGAALSVVTGLWLRRKRSVESGSGPDRAAPGSPSTPTPTRASGHGREESSMTYGATNVPPGGLSEDQIRLKLQGLQHEVDQSANLVRRLRWLAIVMIVLLVVLMSSIHLYHVMQYARVASVEAVAVEDNPGVAEILYSPESAGKIEFVRESEGLVQTLTEYAAAPTGTEKPKKKFNWSGKVGEHSTLRVTYRSGLFLVARELPVTPSQRAQ